MVTEWAAIILFAAVAFYWLWFRTNAVYVVFGAVFVVMTIIATDRAVNSEYRLTDDGRLIVRRGRFGRRKIIRLDDISDVRIMPLAFRLGSFVLIECKDGKVVSLQPGNIDSFVKAVRKQGGLNND